MANYEELFLKDSKEYVKYIIDYYNNSNGDSFDLLMRFFATDDMKFGGYIYDEQFIPFNDLENREFARYAYELLGWNDNSKFDVINSFWATYKSGLHLLYKDYYPYIETEKIVSIGKGSQKKEHYAQKYLGLWKYDTAELHKYARNVVSEYEYGSLAARCHCVANFMPCPDAYEKGKLSYNQLKGVLPEVQDYFPLMIDKIEKCYDDKKGIIYKIKNEKAKTEIQKEITYDTVVSWRNWFIKNRETYCLEDYYEYKDGKLKGVELFKGQTLEHPVPLEKSETEDCLEEMIKRIKTRAMRMAKKLEE